MTRWLGRRSAPPCPCSGFGLRSGFRRGRGSLQLGANVVDIKAALASLEHRAGDPPPQAAQPAVAGGDSSTSRAVAAVRSTRPPERGPM